MRIDFRRPGSDLVAVALWFATWPCLAMGQDWPQWRGPEGQGHAKASDLPVTWNATTNIAWRMPIPGRAWSSPVLDDKQIWMTTAIERPAKPADVERRMKARKGPNNQPLTLLEAVELRAICVDRQTGRIVNDVLLMEIEEPPPVHQLNSYASPSPVLAPGRLYCHFGAMGTACVDTTTGNVLWTNRELVVNHENGPGSTPVLWGDKLIFHMDGSDLQFIAALDTATGKLAWKTDRSGAMNENPDLKKSYGTPLLVSRNGQAELFSPATDWLYSYDEQGRELWKVNYGALGFSQTPRPVVGDGMVFMSTGFMRPSMLAIRFDGADAPAIAWKYAKGAPTMPSPLLVGGELYFVSDNGLLTCLDSKNGEELYRERLGGNFSSSPLFADGKIYVSNREGVTFVVAPGRTYALLGDNDLQERIFATPAAIDKTMFLRTEKALYRIEKP